MQNKKSVLYINYVDLNNSKSGSSVRPKKILDAFLELNYYVKMLTGATLKLNKKERIKNIKKISKWLDSNKTDYCYIESPSSNLILRQDRRLIKKIHKKGIKIGYFYRDIYYKFSKDFIFENKKVSIFSKKYLKFLYHKLLNIRDNLLISKYVDVVFLPSNSMKEYLNFENMTALPPASELVKHLETDNSKDVIYVGGLSKNYGTDILLDAMDLVNKKNFVKLIIVCRKEEVNYIPKKYLDKCWLEIVHAKNSELKDYYSRAKIAIIPKLKSVYNDFAISVKLFEYMSYNLPIVATDCYEQQQIITNEKIGLICKSNYMDMADKINKLYFDDEKINEFKKNIIKSLKDKHLWVHRIKTIENILKGSDL